MTHSANHALVFGGSGLIGWSVVDQLLSGYPEKNSFAKVTAITNRPVNPSETQWPEPPGGRPELHLVSGIDLRSHTQNSLSQVLKDSIQDIENVTHVFYFVFTSMADDTEEVEVNRKMIEVAIDALNVLSPNLQFVVFPGGTRGYGIYIPGGTFRPPLTENMVDNLPQDYARTCVYPVFRQVLSNASSGKKWTWCEVCPDTIVGFTPNGSQFSLALHWAQYLSLYAYNHGIGPHTGGLEQPDHKIKTQVVVPFPGVEAAWKAKNTPVAAKTIARFSIYASLHPKECGSGNGRGQQLFNIADRERPSTCEELWPKLAAWFGLVGVGLPSPADQMAPRELPGEYIEKYQDVFKQYGLDKAATSGVSAGRKQLDSVGTWLTFDRHLSLDKLRASGFAEEPDPTDAWTEAFQKFREGGMIL
ncbi:hypothetical protein E1B28_008373 [Marasmius oreades]|uniref:PRISE-like Rossmann-fold domain-containing protein n=1 Tax=Marasmius oreades TaxID=181124 RepID=A0A9P7RZG5_9AGAR|nr:uncharacterized protein E1B28_008373 [Marasmius oreades]KAG7091986.1 hypothetical protein E1B28_008373 [Marasmius oreades]